MPVRHTGLIPDKRCSACRNAALHLFMFTKRKQMIAKTYRLRVETANRKRKVLGYNNLLLHLCGFFTFHYNFTL